MTKTSLFPSADAVVGNNNPRPSYLHFSCFDVLSVRFVLSNLHLKESSDLLLTTLLKIIKGAR